MSYFTYCLFYTIYQYLSFIILWCCANSGVSAGRILCSNIVAVESSKKWRIYRYKSATLLYLKIWY